MNTLAQAMSKASSQKLTENGALAYSTTNSGMLDFFSFIGSMRNRSENDIIEKFDHAYNENPELAVKALFYTGDIRGGLGERRAFRICLKRLAELNPYTVAKNMEYIPEFNRWDSLLELIGTSVEYEVLNLIKHQWIKDVKGCNANEPISLMAKWLPSENASNKERIKMAKIIRNYLNLNSKEYRQTLSRLRKHLDVVEVKMSASKWEQINYEAVPSRAMTNYRNAFFKHDYDRMKEYIGEVSNGNKKINASVLYPYNLVHTYAQYGCDRPDPVIEEQWKSLPNYVSDDANILIMADVSGSMYGRPMDTSIGLAIYFAQRNNGAFKNLYMTFTSSPRCVKIQPNGSLFDNVNHVRGSNIGYSTNLDSAFKYILDMCVNNDISQEELPSALVVISDMEIDRYGRENRDWSFVDKWERKFAECGYVLPKLILWNVEARNDTILSQNPNVLYVSGQSTSTFKNLTNALNGKTAYEFMVDVLNDERYSVITL